MPLPLDEIEPMTRRLVQFITAWLAAGLDEGGTVRLLGILRELEYNDRDPVERALLLGARQAAVLCATHDEAGPDRWRRYLMLRAVQLG